VVLSCAALLAGPLLSTRTHASISLSVDLEPMPVSELVELLETRWAQAADSRVLAELAHVHALAYILKTEIAQVRTGSPQLGWYSAGVPFLHVVKTSDPAQQHAAEAHLRQARVLYVHAIELRWDDLPLRLDYARLLDISGNRDQAIAQYRKVIALQALDKPIPRTVIDDHFIIVHPSTRYFAEAAARHLIPLLDPAVDRTEIVRLSELDASLGDAERRLILIPCRASYASC
jgi:hypothetical protein